MAMEEAIKAKSVAEHRFHHSSLKSALKYAREAQKLCPELDGISQMLVAFKVHVAAQASMNGEPDWYRILQLEPFSQLNSIKKQYRKLALILHPDKNSCVGSEEAFKWVGKAWGVLSDKIRKKAYDLKRRIALQSEANLGSSNRGLSPINREKRRKKIETFWTACSTCRLFHEFERCYVGQRLMCPSCKKSFLAVEIDSDIVNGSGKQKQKFTDSVKGSASAEIKSGSTRVNGSSEIKRSSSKKKLIAEKSPSSRLGFSSNRRVSENRNKLKRKGDKVPDLPENSDHKKMKLSNKSKPKREKTLAEIQMVVKRNAEKAKSEQAKQQSLISMPVDDSDFYNFDKDRDERSFRKGQVWAVYDDDDGMPRHYGIIDDVESVNPFKLQMNWLDIQNNGDEALVCWEKSGFHVTCGRFKVGRKVAIDSVNVFSHVMQCERVAREIYRIDPIKGSVWALYGEGVSGGDERIPSIARRQYDVVVFLTSCSEAYGLSIAFLEKVDGFKTIFVRREVGCNAIKWLEKEDFRLFSHQIPARKLLGTEALDLPKDCWELDPAALPYELLRS